MEKLPGMTFKQFRALAVAVRKAGLFKDPTIIRCKNGDWYVGYFFLDPETAKWKEFKERCGLNYIKDAAEKESQAEILRIDVLNWLLAGNNPFNKRSTDLTK